jgi:uncharacterized membrane protein
MTVEHPVVARYMAQFEQSLRGFDYPEQQEAAHEIRNHIAEACAAGKPLAGVLTSLGSADLLARAYAAELLLNRRTSQQMQSALGFLKLAGLVAVVSLATFVVVGILGTTFVGFVASGAAIMVIGVLEQAGIHLPGVQMNGTAPALAIALGLLVFSIGILALFGLRAYVRFMIRAGRTLRPESRTVSIFA